jgi:protein tyrosine/serine phosphatase
MLLSCTPPSSAIVIDSTELAKQAPIVNFQTVEPQGIYRGGQPWNEADWTFLKGIGVKTVVKLNQYANGENTLQQERSEAEKHGIQLIELPMQPEDWPHNWNLWVTPSPDKLKAAEQAIANKGNWPVFVHCSHGQDRTGLVVAVYRVAHNNYCKDKAYNEMKLYHHNTFLFGLKNVLYSADVKEHADCIP